jgi:RimJ/RimL family protein N-acetyltransferase
MSSKEKLSVTVRRTKNCKLIRELNARPEFFPLDPLSEDGLASSEWFLAKSGGEIIGWCGYNLTADGTAKITRTGVIPKCQGRGVKSRMVKAMERAAKKRGAHTMTSYCDIDNIASANSLINSGYKLYDPIYIWASGTCLYWRKKL